MLGATRAIDPDLALDKLAHVASLVNEWYHSEYKHLRGLGGLCQSVIDEPTTNSSSLLEVVLECVGALSSLEW